MKKVSILAVLITLTLWLGGCTGRVALDWGPKGIELESTNRPAASMQYDN